MKFLLTQELQQNPLLKLVVLFLLAILSTFLLTDLMLYHLQIGLSLEKATETLMGDEKNFLEPMVFDALLAHVHISLFTSMMTLILINIIYMRVTNTQRSKIIHLASIAAICAPIVLLLAYVYGTAFIQLWIVLFVLWHLSALYLALATVWKLLKG